MVEISLAKWDDIPEMANLLSVLFGQEVEFKPNVDKQLQGLRQIVENPLVGQLFVAKLKGETVGMVSLLFLISTALGGKVALLEDMVVKPGVRGEGIGSRLMECALDYAKQNGFLRLTLLTDGDNVRAQKFYKKHGFVGSDMQVFRQVF